jgi:hypothetical protein
MTMAKAPSIDGTFYPVQVQRKKNVVMLFV